MRVYRPTGPVVALGRRDTRLQGSGDAVRVAREQGFEPVVRAVGGRAVAYTSAALVVDQVGVGSDNVEGLDRRFEEFGHRFVGVLRDLGIDARLGPVAGEYCPGAQSVNARGEVKLVGTAQRVVRGAWLFSSLVVLGEHERLRPVLGDVYRALDLPLDPASVGSVAEEAGDVDADALEAAVLRAWSLDRDLDEAPVDEETLALADRLEPDHTL